MESDLGGDGMKERDIVQEDNGLEGLGEDKGYEIQLKKYERDIRSFDRISWVDVHILHSTVSLAHPACASIQA